MQCSSSRRLISTAAKISSIVRRIAALDSRFRPWVIAVVGRPLLQELLQLRIRVLRQDHLQCDVLIAALARLAIEQAAALEAEHRPCVRTGRNLDADPAIDRRHGHGGAEHRLRQGDWEIEVYVRILASEKGVRLHLNLDVSVSGRTAANTWQTLTFQP